MITTNDVVINPQGKREGSWKPSQDIHTYGKAGYGCRLKEGHSRQREPHVGRNPNYSQAEESLEEITPVPTVLRITEESNHKKLKFNSVSQPPKIPRTIKQSSKVKILLEPSRVMSCPLNVIRIFLLPEWPG